HVGELPGLWQLVHGDVPSAGRDLFPERREISGRRDGDPLLAAQLDQRLPVDQVDAELLGQFPGRLGEGLWTGLLTDPITRRRRRIRFVVAAVWVACTHHEMAERWQVWRGMLAACGPDAVVASLHRSH